MHKFGNVISYTDDLPGDVMAQAARAGSMPFIFRHVALMPDAHLGKGSTIGSVIPTKGAIIPAAVGVDLGCGMIASKLNLTASELPDDLSALLSDIERLIPAGVGRGRATIERGSQYLNAHPNETLKTAKDKESIRAVNQFGTLGSGNHFLELCVGVDESVWLVVHSGSRGVGNWMARQHISKASKMMRDMFINLPDPDLAYFVQNTPEFDHYIADMQWAQNYAWANREEMMKTAIELVNEAVGVVGERVRAIDTVNCHHNYAAQEHHYGENIWVTRKGAISARAGQRGVIPGSMGTSSFIVRGLGNYTSFTSAPHGAGRKMSRTQAKREFGAESLSDAMEGKTWLGDKAGQLIDEHPGAYKDIGDVIRESAELVEVELEVEQVLNYKGA